MKIFANSLLLIVLVLGACASAADESEQARQALVRYFDSLNRANYEATIDLYGGSYEGMIDSNPSVAPDDRLTLWENACTINGNECDLLVRTVTFQERKGDEYSFLVEFNDPDGTMFILGPCCGGSATDFPPVSEFEYRVKKLSNGKFVVLDMPVYVP
jgi:hypothetical protein